MSNQQKLATVEKYEGGWWWVMADDGVRYFLRYADFRPSSLAAPSARVLLKYEKQPTGAWWTAHATNGVNGNELSTV
jgi:hypothetical protein